jgi:glycyl-tRNA synthetase beta chain
LPLLVEIGCEEIPAQFLAAAQRDFGEHLQEALREAVLLIGAVRKPPLQTYSTPRRLVAHVAGVLAHQPDKLEEIRGPAVKAAFDAQGCPTRAAESFAAKNNATVEELVKVSTPKGEYVAVQKHIRGRPALEVLPKILPAVISGLSFPKSMYWEKSKTHFIRPIRWVLAVLGGGETVQVVPFEIAGVKSGNVTYGHRGVVNLPSGPFTRGRAAGAFRASTETRPFGAHAASVNSFPDYATKLRGLGVEFDPEARRRSLRLALQVLPVMPNVEGIQDMGQDWHTPEGSEPEERLEELRSGIKALPEVPELRVVEDKELEDWVVNSTECPNALMGSFQERFLELPREILVTVMRDHQKYFALEDKEGKLRPRFVASLNLDSDPRGLIRAGHERVLTARFSDAGFFWKADQKIPLRDRLPMLERVTYQAKLGSYADKVRRMEAIAKNVCATLESQGRITGDDTSRGLRAIELCKCDLTTQMVQEFTELQGIVGGLYAAAQGELKDVADAVYDHYLPAGMGDRVPGSIVGGIVSLADKLDSVIAGFSAGLEPTGSSDPFGLRRAGNGIIKLSVELLPTLDLVNLLNQATDANLELPPAGDLFDNTTRFLRERTESYLETVAGLRYDTVRAVLHSLLGWGKPADALARGRALERIRDSDDFVALSTAAKRTRNILNKSAESEDLIETIEPVKEELLTAGPEQDLYSVYEQLRPSLDELVARGQYEEGFRELAGLRPQVDRFFDRVLVMDDNMAVRRNRLNLLSKLTLLVFLRFADLSQIETKTSSFVDAPTSTSSSIPK